MRKFLAAALIVCLCLFPMAVQADGDHVSGDNLIFNPDFSESSEILPLPAGWMLDAYQNDAASVQTSLEALENGAVSLRLTNLAANDSRVYQQVDVAGGAVYRLTALLKTESVSGGQGATLSIDNYGVDGSYCYSESVSGSTDWTRITLYFQTGEQQTQIRVALRLGGYGAESAGTVWFSDVSLFACDDVESGMIIDLASSTGASASSGSDADDAAEVRQGGATMFPLTLLVSAGIAVAGGLLYVRLLRTEADGIKNPNRPGAVLGIVFALAFLLRLVLSLIFVGHPTDIACFMAWGNAVLEHGVSGFYTSGMFADYPPGYMYVCGAIAGLCRLLGISYGSAGMVFLYKMPATIADIASAYLVYRIARKQGVREVFALTLAGLLALNPTAMFISGAWGQIDSVLTLGIVAACYLLLNDQLVAAGAVYGLAILFKPQALMFGPLLAVAYFVKVYQSESRGKTVLKTVLAVLAAFAVLILGSLPFQGTQPFGWLVEKYLSTTTSYPYATIEAFNFPALLGHNWAPVDTRVLGVPYSTWGPLFIGLSVLLGAALYIVSSTKRIGTDARQHASVPMHEGALYLSAACMLSMILTFGHYMHERYLFPVLLLLLMAYLYERDRRILVSFLSMTVTLLINALAAMYIVDHQWLRGPVYDAITRVGAALELAGFLYLLWISIDILFRNRVHKPVAAGGPEPAARENKRTNRSSGTPVLPPLPTDNRLRYTGKDRLLLLGLVLVYGAVALTNLGTLSAPETDWTPQTPGETVTVEFPAETAVGEYWIYGNIQNNGILLLRAGDGHEETYTQTYDEMFRWDRVQTAFTARTVELQLYSGSLKLNEIAFFDTAGNRIEAVISNPSGSQAALLDEQDTVPDRPSYFNGMYFDELYHARTAYEHLHNLAPYENSHPPLGKLIIAIGVAVFGMNPFGWRIMGALIGIAMLPVLYAFGKRLFRKTEYAFLCTALFAFDFMHFTQTRIATIDVYAVFFILLMYYYMYQYITMNFFTDGLSKTLKPLALSGLFFGLGAASKWICIYAGAGLAVLFFGSLAARYFEYAALTPKRKGGQESVPPAGRRNEKNGTERERELVQPFWKNVLYTLLWCCLFFLLVPFIIYFCSYLPYYIYEGSRTEGYGLSEAFDTFWRYQNFMFSYHSGLEATHPYQSAWWQWPFTMRPMWYYSGNDAAAGIVSTLTASGNPAVWWVGTIGAVALLLLRLSGFIKPDRAQQIFCVGVLANYLPWVLVPRCTFIYHFFATVPFLLMAAVYLLQKAEERYPKLSCVKWIWLGLAVLLFILLYPGLSGLPIPAWWGALIKYLPGGALMYGA